VTNKDEEAEKGNESFGLVFHNGGAIEFEFQDKERKEEKPVAYVPRLFMR
jgi:hypothetical protein